MRNSAMAYFEFVARFVHQSDERARLFVGAVAQGRHRPFHGQLFAVIAKPTAAAHNTPRAKQIQPSASNNAKAQVQTQAQRKCKCRLQCRRTAAPATQ